MIPSIFCFFAVLTFLIVSTAFSLMISCATAIPVENSKTKKVSAILLFMDFICIDFESIIGNYDVFYFKKIVKLLINSVVI